MTDVEKVVFVEFTKNNTQYVPENGYVVRDMKLDGNKAIIWIQKQNYYN